MTLAVEPLKPLNRGLYRCDNRFHTDLLREHLVDSGARFGFIIMCANPLSLPLPSTLQFLFLLQKAQRYRTSSPSLNSICSYLNPFIGRDGSDVSFYLLNGKNRETLFEWSKVNLPKKHGRGISSYSY